MKRKVASDYRKKRSELSNFEQSVFGNMIACGYACLGVAHEDFESRNPSKDGEDGMNGPTPPPFPKETVAEVERGDVYC